MRQPALHSLPNGKQLGNEKLTFLTNLIFDTQLHPNVQWFSLTPKLFTAFVGNLVRPFRSNDSGNADRNL
jgi:hypothetical protein